MNRKFQILAGLTLLPVVIVLAVAVAQYGSPSDSELVYKTLAETGAEFAADFGDARDADFNATIAKQDAKETAVAEFMSGFDLPEGREIEQKIDIRAVKAIFSGSSDGFSRNWDIIDREVWVVALWDLPISIPCGGSVAGGCQGDFQPPHFTLAIDAHTGQIVGADLSGVGSISSTWDDVDLQRSPDSELAESTPDPSR